MIKGRHERRLVCCHYGTGQFASKVDLQASKTPITWETDHYSDGRGRKIYQPLREVEVSFGAQDIPHIFTEIIHALDNYVVSIHLSKMTSEVTKSLLPLIQMYMS